MSSGGQESYSFIPRWNEEVATLEAFEQRVKLFVSSTKKAERYLCGPRLLSTLHQEGDTFRYVRDNLTDIQFVPSHPRKVFACCWISSDSILCDENMVKPRGTGHVDSHCNARKLARH